MTDDIVLIWLVWFSLAITKLYSFNFVYHLMAELSFSFVQFSWGSFKLDVSYISLFTLWGALEAPLTEISIMHYFVYMI